MALFKKQEQETPPTPQDLRKKIASLEKRVEETNKELQELKAHGAQSITKVNVVRFNPFKEIGGDQSFCVALLDSANNGVIITSYYGRELNRVYAKQVLQGTSQYELSAEEKQAINQAIANNNGNSKHRTSK